MINHPWPALLVTWFLTSGLGASSSVTFAGLELTDDPQKELTNYTFEGFVVEPDGTSAEGAVVVTSAGGQAATDVNGRFLIVVDVPVEAESVQLTAVGRTGKNLVANLPVQVDARFEYMQLGALLLAPASTCSPSWLPTFGPAPGLDNTIFALTVFDDGNGSALYAGGNFTQGGSGIAKWDGTFWKPLGTGTDACVYALTVFDDGTGDALYAGGSFVTAGGISAPRIAKWDGASWSAVGMGMNDEVRTLEVFDDGTGAALYAGGMFTVAGGMPAGRLAKLEGSEWSSISTGFAQTVHALQVFDDGTDEALYVGGDFTHADGVPAPGIAKWDGSSFSTVGGGMNGFVYAMTVYDDGAGPALYAGGDFVSAGGVTTIHIAKWNGSTWSALLSPLNGVNQPVRVLTTFDDGNGARLYAGGEFNNAGGLQARFIAKWDGSDWSTVGSLGASDIVFALAVFDNGSEAKLFLGGDFELVDNVAADHVASWNGSIWGLAGGSTNNHVYALEEFDDGGGPALYAGGVFNEAGDQLFANRLAKWDGSSWTKLGNGVTGGIPVRVRVLKAFDDGTGPALFVGGVFKVTDNTQIQHIAKWDGSTFASLAGVPNGEVLAMEVFNDGSGDELFVGGNFSEIGGQTVNSVAKWNGSTWTDLNGGVSGPGATRVQAFSVFDDGSGDALYVGGGFTSAGGTPANRIAKWNGSTWVPVGLGLEFIVESLCTFDDGNGEALYAGGFLSSAGGMLTSRAAKWDGVQWSTFEAGVESGSRIRALTTFDDGGGMALYAGGSFQTTGGVAANLIARWDGSNWTPLSSGLNGFAVSALTTFDDGDGDALFVGGLFTQPDTGDAFLAKWGCSDSTAPVINCPGSVTAIDRVRNGPGEFVRFKVSAIDDLDPSPTVICTPPLGSFFAQGSTLVTCTATDSSGNQSTCQFTVVVKPKNSAESQSDLDQ